MSPAPLSTPITKLFNISHPILLAGMNGAFRLALQAPRLRTDAPLTSRLRARVGSGSYQRRWSWSHWGFGYTPKYLQQQLTELKEGLRDKGAPFGVDLLLPAVGELRRTCSSFGCETISFRKLIGDAGKVETRERRTRTVRNSAWLRFAAPDSLSRQIREENWQSLSI